MQSLYQYVINGDIELLIKAIEKKGLDVHATNYNRRTLLHVAVIWNNLSIVQYLLTKNVDINAVDVYGYTALNYV